MNGYIVHLLAQAGAPDPEWDRRRTATIRKWNSRQKASMMTLLRLLRQAVSPGPDWDTARKRVFDRNVKVPLRTLPPGTKVRLPREAATYVVRVDGQVHLDGWENVIKRPDPGTLVHMQ